MKLPNTDEAIVDLTKLRDYCLDPEHPRGRHKARVFASVLGLTAAHAEELRDALLAAVRTEKAVPQEKDDFGARYVVEFMMMGPRGRARVRSSWIIWRGEYFPRLTSCYVA